MLKLFQLLLGSCCETLLIKFGLKSSGDIGQGLNKFFVILIKFEKFRCGSKSLIKNIVIHFSISWIPNYSFHMLNYYFHSYGVLFCVSQNRRLSEVFVVCKYLKHFIFSILPPRKKRGICYKYLFNPKFSN